MGAGYRFNLFAGVDRGYSAIENLRRQFRENGYTILSAPIEGAEKEYEQELINALRKVNDTAAFIRSYYKTGGRFSKNTLAFLHNELPEPTFGVHVAKD